MQPFVNTFAGAGQNLRSTSCAVPNRDSGSGNAFMDEKLKIRALDLIDRADDYSDIDKVLNDVNAAARAASGFVSDEDIKAIIVKYAFCMKNRCFICGLDMGMNNPRQYCRKTFCPKMYLTTNA